MPMDKSWISKPRNTTEYAVGLSKFLDFAFQHQSIEGCKIKCPCSKCGFKKWQTREVVQEHLTLRPFPENYKIWYWHGEESNVTESEAFEGTHVMENTFQPQNPTETMINVDYHLRPETMRKKTGKTIGRGSIWNITHKKKDRSFVNDETEKIEKEIDKHLSLREDNYSEISPNDDVVGVVFGKEHSGSVRGLGMGVVPTIAFKHTTRRLGAMNFGSSSSNTSSPDLRQKVVTMESQLQALCAYIAMKEGGRLPEELAGLFNNPTPQVPDQGSGTLSPNDQRRSWDESNTYQSVDISSSH